MPFDVAEAALYRSTYGSMPWSTTSSSIGQAPSGEAPHT
ncbi:MAG: hypothetical protein OJF51_004787 [Nitrospira sp.]|nr:MAG: hypothetical protein OJF51_004787 [Nitrospira sp.]